LAKIEQRSKDLLDKRLTEFETEEATDKQVRFLDEGRNKDEVLEKLS